jgi:hypothetical protein
LIIIVLFVVHRFEEHGGFFLFVVHKFEEHGGFLPGDRNDLSGLNIQIEP